MFRDLATLVALALALGTAPGALAHGEAKPQYGGVVAKVNELQYELVVKGDTLIIYLTDHGKPLASKGATGKIVLVSGSEKGEAMLEPTIENRMEAKSPIKVGAGTKAVATITVAGQKPASARFAVK
jgi:hypothetical protein